LSCLETKLWGVERGVRRNRVKRRALGMRRLEMEGVQWMRRKTGRVVGWKMVRRGRWLERNFQMSCSSNPEKE